VRLRRPFWRAVATVCAMAVGVVVAPDIYASSPGLTISPIFASPPASADKPRVAFTDDGDHLVRSGSIGVTASVAGPVSHEGEESYNSKGLRSFVRADATNQNGDIYASVGVGGSDIAITCGNSDIETHPVVSPDGTKIAYASNAGGRFNIWIAWLPAAPAVPTCATIQHAQLTHAAGDSLWPTWVDDFHVVFSSTRDDPLGELYYELIGTADAPSPDGAALRLTNDAAADTQPAAAQVDTCGDGCLHSFVLFTTTHYRTDGSLAAMLVPSENDALPGPVSSVWPSGEGSSPIPQSSEASWSSLGDAFAFSTTKDDPHGDVRSVNLNLDTTTSTSVEALDVRDSLGVATAPGVAESHAAWSAGTAIDYTQRDILADVSDVVAADGSDRRTVANGRTDEAGPAYSPDGTKIAYRRKVADSDDGGCEIIVANSDGSTPVVLVDGQHARDCDSDPVWSPEGTRIAFVRQPRPIGVAFPPPTSVWVVDLASHAAHSLAVAPPSTELYYDSDPSWSPDSTRLAITRNTVVRPDVVASVSAAPAQVVLNGTTTVTASVTNSGPGPAHDVSLVVTAPAGLPLSGPVTSACVVSPQQMRCDFGTVPAGESRTVTVIAQGTTVGSHEVTAAADTTSADLDPSNDKATATVTVRVPTADVSMFLIPTAATINIGSATPLEADFTNDGPDSAANVQLVFTLDAGLAVSGRDPTVCPTLSGQVLTCMFGSIAHNSGFNVPVTIRGDAGGAHNVAVSLTTTTNDPDLTNNNATAVITVRTITVRVAGSRELVPQSRGAIALRPSVKVHPAAALKPKSMSKPRAVRGFSGLSLADSTSSIWTIDAGTGIGDVLRLLPPSCPPPTVGCDKPVVSGRSPAWSPDGLAIAYDDHGAIKIAVLRDANHDGAADVPEAATALNAVTGFGPGGAPTPSRPVISLAEDPAWSPDGSELAVAGQPAGQPDQRGIYALKPDGSGLRVLAQARGPETEPAWQPYADVGVTIGAAPPVIVVGATTLVTTTVTNNGPGRAADVVLTVDVPAGLTAPALPAPCLPVVGGYRCPLGTLASGAHRSVSVIAHATSAGAKTLTATATTASPDPVAPNNQATFTVLVNPPGADVAVTLSLTNNLGYVGGTNIHATITVTNVGPQTATGVELRMSYPVHVIGVGPPGCLSGTVNCLLGSLAPGDSRVLHAALGFSAAANGDVVAKVSATELDPDLSNNVALAHLTVKQPTVRMLPPIGSPGFVSLAYGVDFPPGVDVVSLTWSPGITANDGPFPVDSDGTFRLPILIIRRDELGNRVLKAAAHTAGLFGTVTAPMLVVPRTLSPPRFLGRG